jgi:hypothetical protein
LRRSKSPEFLVATISLLDNSTQSWSNSSKICWTTTLGSARI